MSETSTFEWSSDSLKLLYQVTSTLNSADEDRQILHDFLFLIKQHFHSKATSIQLITNDGLMNLVAYDGISEEQANGIQHTPIDGHLFSFETDVIDEIQIHDSELDFDNRKAIQTCIPVRYKIRTLGVINLFTLEPLDITEELAYLLLSIGAHLGETLKKQQNEALARSQLVQEERNMIANELHDSLAQTLASLRFQVRILDQSLQPVGDFMAIRTIEQVEHGLDEASTDLRELIAHCRIPIEEHGLIPAIQRVVEKFKQETGIHILLQCEIDSVELPTNMELNAYRIVQESLTNIKKHANAHIVRVLITEDDEHNIRILIENDGKGFEQSKIQSDAGQHLGLTIMKERARHLGGELKIESEVDEGTRVELKFNHRRRPGKTPDRLTTLT